MGQINPTLPVSGVTPNSTADPEVVAAFNAILGVINGGIDATNLSTALAQAAAVNQAGQVVKGATNIPAAQSTSSNVWVTLGTPDQVTGIVLPANGVIRVWYQATWQESVANAARAAIFLNSNQLKADVSNAGAPQTQAAAKSSDTPGVNGILASCSLGLLGTEATAYSGDVTTGQAIGMWTPGASGASGFAEIGGTVESVGDATGFLPFGGPCDIFAAAGNYTVSVQFKVSSGSLTASNRKLWVQTLSFA